LQFFTEITTLSPTPPQAFLLYNINPSNSCIQEIMGCGSSRPFKYDQQAYGAQPTYPQGNPHQSQQYAANNAAEQKRQRKKRQRRNGAVLGAM
jgi:hypothetical protein